jgi:hypothetical protein
MTPRSLARTRMIAVTMLSSTLLAAALAGCAARDDEDEIAAPIAPAMDIDPVDMIEMPPWFTNSDITIAFDSSGLYRMFQGTNRHAKPIERGRWIRVNYASVSLEPYAVGREAAPMRGTLVMQNGALVLQLPKTKPLLALAGPPRVMEDELFGTWAGDSETIELRRDMRFVYKRTGDSRQPAALAGIAGAWRIEGEHLILRPDSSAIESMEYAIKRDGDAVTLEVNGMALRPK